MNGTMMSAPNVRNCAAPPAFWNHLPMRSPLSAMVVMPTIASTLTTGVYHAAPVSQVAVVPARYERFVAIMTPNVAMMSTP